MSYQQLGQHYSRYWIDCVDNNLMHISKALGAISIPRTEEEAKNLYHRWLEHLTLRGEDL